MQIESLELNAFGILQVSSGSHLNSIGEAGILIFGVLAAYLGVLRLAVTAQVPTYYLRLHTSLSRSDVMATLYATRYRVGSFSYAQDSPRLLK